MKIIDRILVPVFVVMVAVMTIFGMLTMFGCGDGPTAPTCAYTLPAPGTPIATVFAPGNPYQQGCKKL